MLLNEYSNTLNTRNVNEIFKNVHTNIFTQGSIRDSKLKQMVS